MRTRERQFLPNRDCRRIAVLHQVQAGVQLVDGDAGLEGFAHFGEQGSRSAGRGYVTQDLKKIKSILFPI